VALTFGALFFHDPKRRRGRGHCSQEKWPHLHVHFNGLAETCTCVKNTVRWINNTRLGWAIFKVDREKRGSMQPENERVRNWTWTIVSSSEGPVGSRAADMFCRMR
jgi:hypothetical protein